MRCTFKIQVYLHTASCYLLHYLLNALTATLFTATKPRAFLSFLYSLSLRRYFTSLCKCAFVYIVCINCLQRVKMRPVIHPEWKKKTITRVYAFTVLLFFLLAAFLSQPLSFAPEMVGVSIRIQLEARSANNSWQSQTPSLINGRDRGSRLPSSPVLIAVIESPLTHEHQSHILSLCGLLLPYTTDR